MKKHSLAAAVALALLHGTPAIAAGFVDDSKASLTLRNFYFDRDFRSGNGQSQAQEWAQGFILRMDSGYTEGTVGFGLNLLGTAGFKLDSSVDRRGTGLLPFDPETKEPKDNYSELGLAAKARISASELQVGTLSPLLPVILPVQSRLFAPTFRGGYLRSQDIDKLTLHAGHMDRINLRDSTNYQEMRISSPNRRFIASAESESFDFAGGDYRWSDSLTTSYFYAQLDDLYEQHYLGMTHFLPLGGGKLKSDLRYFDSGEDGAASAGEVDNRSLGLMLTWLRGAHALGVGYLQQSGATAMPYLAGTDVHVNTEGALVSEYVNPDERVWQARYDYDFAGVGVPGLRAMARYIRGDNIELSTIDYRAKERERDLELAYAVQSGALKGVALRVRHASYRNDFSRDVDETRVNVDYTLALW